MKLATIIVTRSKSCHVKTLHTILQLNIKCIQKGWEQRILFVNDDPYEKADMIEKSLKEYDRTLFIDFGIQSDTTSNVLNKTTAYSYDDNGNISGVVIRNDRISKRQNFIYQYDNHAPSNWVKKIELPSNKYINRIITYYTEQ